MQRVESALLWKTNCALSPTCSKYHNWKSSLSLQVWSVRSEFSLPWHVRSVAQPAEALLDSPIDAQRPLLTPMYCNLMYIKAPALHEDVPDTVYPELHVGWHVDPLANELVQSPTPPFVGAVDASHGFAEQVAAVSVPALHEDVPDTEYPGLHVGWHVDPLANELVQSPISPFKGAIEASHARE